LIPDDKNNPPPPLTDEDLVQLYVSTQSSVYFDQIYERYATKVYGKCLTLLHCENAAQDALQDIFLKIFLNIANFNANSRFTTWVYAVSYNYCMDFIRKQRRTRDVFEEQDLDHYKDVKEVEDYEMTDIDSEYLPNILKYLSTEDRVVLLMKYQDGMQIKEICEVLEKSESAVKMQLKRAKHRAKTYYIKLSEQKKHN
jgi:RNA polymerase sigma factor (sigma-70 family)